MTVTFVPLKKTIAVENSELFSQDPKSGQLYWSRTNAQHAPSMPGGRVGLFGHVPNPPPESQFSPS